MNTDTHTAPELLDLPARDVLAVDGAGAPASGAFTSAFTSAIGALFALRAALGAPADVPLEGTFTQDGEPLRFDLEQADGWRWRLAVPAPDGGTAESLAAAGADARVRLVHQPAQRVARLLHHGPYVDEQPSLDALHAYVVDAGLRVDGPHTEVYLTDPATTAPAELRTWLQVPVR